MMHLLLKYKADLSVRDRYTETILYRAMRVVDPASQCNASSASATNVNPIKGGQLSTAGPTR